MDGGKLQGGINLHFPGSACSGAGGKLLLCFVGTEASRPSSWFFQLYKVGLPAPNFSATDCAVSPRVKFSMTPACFIELGYGGANKKLDYQKIVHVFIKISCVDRGQIIETA